MEGVGFYLEYSHRTLVHSSASKQISIQREKSDRALFLPCFTPQERMKRSELRASVLEVIKYDSHGALHVYFYLMGPSELLGILYIVNVLNLSLLILHTSSDSRIFHFLIRDDYFQHVWLLRFRSLVPTNLGWDCFVFVVGGDISHPSENQSNIFGLIEV